MESKNPNNRGNRENKKEESDTILCVIGGVCLTGIFIVAVTIL